MRQKQNRNPIVTSGTLVVFVAMEQIRRFAQTACLAVKHCLPFATGSDVPVACIKGNSVVSTRRYLLAVGDRAVSRLIGFTFFLLSLLAAILCVTCVLLLPRLLFMDAANSRNALSLPCLMVGIPLTYFLWQSSRHAFRRAASVPAVVPLTHANTADLPAPDSLVRASSKSVQEQQAVLLRAAKGMETPPEQLVRASVEQEKAGGHD